MSNIAICTCPIVANRLDPLRSGSRTGLLYLLCQSKATCIGRPSRVHAAPGMLVRKMSVGPKAWTYGLIYWLVPFPAFLGALQGDCATMSLTRFLDDMRWIYCVSILDHHSEG